MSNLITLIVKQQETKQKASRTYAITVLERQYRSMKVVSAIQVGKKMIQRYARDNVFRIVCLNTNKIKRSKKKT